MKATIVQVPRGFGLGHPPRRIAEVVLVFADGSACTRGRDENKERITVFDDEGAVLAALRTIEGARAVPIHLVLGWQRRVREERDVPCLACRAMHPEGARPEGCAAKVARRKIRPVRGQLAPGEGD